MHKHRHPWTGKGTGTEIFKRKTEATRLPFSTYLKPQKVCHYGLAWTDHSVDIQVIARMTRGKLHT